MSDYLIRDIPPGLIHQLKVRAAQEDVTMKKLIVEALEEYIKKGK